MRREICLCCLVALVQVLGVVASTYVNDCKLDHFLVYVELFHAPLLSRRMLQTRLVI